MTLRFLRNKVVEVEPQADGDLFVSWRLTDDLLKVELRLQAQPPDLEIMEAEARFDRFVPEAWKKAPDLIKKIEGVRIGSGLRKIVAGLLGGPAGCDVLVNAVLESSNAVILHYTRPGIESREELPPEEKMAGTRENLKNNPRLVRSCIVFQDDSPLMQALGLGGTT
jgi:hypothetical protein